MNRNRKRANALDISLFIPLVLLHLVLMRPLEAIKLKCSNIDELYYSHPSGRCNAFYRCTAKGQSERKECDSGSIFDFQRQRCSRASGTCYEPVCAGRSNGVYQDTTHACRGFYTCYAGHLTSIDNCPAKQLHNGIKCVSQDLVSCDPPETTSAGYPFAGEQSSNQLGLALSGIAVIDDFVCQNRRDGTGADPTSLDCSSYVICQNGKLAAQKRCSPGAVFNGESCVPGPLYQCPPSQQSRGRGLSSESCRGIANGLYPAAQYGCTAYIRCLAGSLVEISACPSDHYFDLETHSCLLERLPERRRCTDLGQSRDCEGKASGWHSEVDCQGYHHCHRGVKLQYRCSPGKLFNGSSCVSKHNYSCPASAQQEESEDPFCLERADGYHKDSSDGCRSYHFCSSGRKITYLCGEGHIYDPTLKKCTRVNHLAAMALCQSDLACLGKSDGYYASLRSNCRSYHYCKSSERAAEITCRQDNVFNGQKCVSPAIYACPSLYNHRQINCMPRRCAHRCQANGFFADLSSDCRDYYFCIDGRPSRLSCPAGKRFNGELCVSDASYSCPALCDAESNDGRSRSDCPLGGYVEFN